jgi:hypothetical protein
MQHDVRGCLPNVTCRVNILLHEYDGTTDTWQESCYMKINNTNIASSCDANRIHAFMNDADKLETLVFVLSKQSVSNVTVSILLVRTKITS